MITSLDDPSALDPELVGAKAAALARARQRGLPVLPGFVVEATVSARHMELGASALATRGSGGARLVVSSEPIPDAVEIDAAGKELSATLAVRSSSPLEGEGRWAGAFTSYIGISPEELPKAVAGCWASVFSVDALERQRRAGIEPGSVPMAVLMQPFIDPTVGGIAEISPDRALRVVAVGGSPAPLLQGWEGGVAATRRPGHGWQGAEAIALVGMGTLDEIGVVLGDASQRFGFTRCEWGVAGSLWILQLGNVAGPASIEAPAQVATPPELIPLVQARFAAGASGVSDPMAAAVVLDYGERIQGVPAAPGIGVGLLHHIALPDGQAPPRRAVLSAPSALPNLSQLIWDAAGLVTGRGSPVAHVFEAARSLRVPAVSGVDLESRADEVVAVDGYSGVVATLPLRAQPIP